MTQKRFRLFALTPCIGFLGVVISLPMWFPVVASAVCFTMLPIAYVIFLALNNKRSYIGDAVGKGWKRGVFNAILVAALVFACIGSYKSLKTNVWDKLTKKPAAPVPAATATPDEAALESEVPPVAPSDDADVPETAPDAN